MTTDHKTLADVQPGGRVRLGDQAERARFEAWANSRGWSTQRWEDGLRRYASCDTEKMWEAFQAALSAQPSPGGQDGPAYEGHTWVSDYVLAALRERAAMPLQLRNGEVWHWQGDGHDFPESLACPVIMSAETLRALLAARRPVGEPVAWISRIRCVGPEYGKEIYGKLPVQSLNPLYYEHIPLYAAPPAQTVDLGAVRDVFRRWHANELNSTDAMLALVEALAVIDGQAVGQEPLWCLHVLGMDDVHPAPSKAHAEKAAAWHNEQFKDQAARLGISIEAKVVPWPHSAESHAAGVAEFIPQWLIPQWQLDTLEANAAPPAQAVDLGAVRALLQRRIEQWRSHLPSDPDAPGTREIETKGEHDYNNDVRIYREGIAVMEEVLSKIDGQAVGNGN